MKGNFYRLKGRHLSVTLLVLTFTTIVLWAWEKNPFVTTLWSAQEQFNFHTSEFVVDAPKGSSFDSLTPNEHVQEKDSNPTRLEESQIPEKEFDASNFTNSVVPETEDGDAHTKPSSKIKEFVVDTPKGASFDSLTPNEHVQETDSDPTRSEESKIPEKEFDASNFTNLVVPETKDGDADREPSSKIKGFLVMVEHWAFNQRPNGFTAC